ncbi:hypothetical protein [uncultured Amphritea sp.]|uniref:hypothetical protein n=1 Tax=uncultured Amphritea sp. TaxID=981605 RepID=UPI0025E873CF|nr:hypothetical protein [uncultured Amphritea sp.]
MKMMQRVALGTEAVVMLFSLAGCSVMSRQDKNTAIGSEAIEVRSQPSALGLGSLWERRWS